MFFLDDADRELIARRRGEHNRLGFALQLTTARWLGVFLPDPTDVPAVVLEYLARQLEVEVPSCVGRYLERRRTRFEHVEEIKLACGLREFTQVRSEFEEWAAARAWMTGDGPRAIFVDAVGWLRERDVLLPGVTTLARLVARARADGPVSPAWGGWHARRPSRARWSPGSHRRAGRRCDAARARSSTATGPGGKRCRGQSPRARVRGRSPSARRTTRAALQIAATARAYPAAGGHPARPLLAVRARRHSGVGDELAGLQRRPERLYNLGHLRVSEPPSAPPRVHSRGGQHRHAADPGTPVHASIASSGVLIDDAVRVCALATRASRDRSPSPARCDRRPSRRCAQALVASAEVLSSGRR